MPGEKIYSLQILRPEIACDFSKICVGAAVAGEACSPVRNITE